VKAARNDGQRRRAAFWALRVAKANDIRCQRTRERRRSSPRVCGGRSCGGRRKTTTTGGGGDRVLAVRRLQADSGALITLGRLGKLLRR
jgi:hypothetical protein